MQITSGLFFATRAGLANYAVAALFAARAALAFESAQVLESVVRKAIASTK